MSEPILTERRNGVGILTLNAEKTLNALSLAMVAGLYKTLRAWQSDPTIHAVFLQGAGEKAFCAGGDVVRLYEAIQTQNAENDHVPAPACVQFFIEEYRLDYLIHRYDKPIIVWADGIVMGGGMGLLAGASHRIVTEKSKLAMPEVTIGLYPDVGGTWFLNKMPGSWGLYTGLTATRLNGADARYLGLADFHLDSSLKSDLWQQLDRLDWDKNAKDAHSAITAILQVLNTAQLPESPCQQHQGFIEKFDDVTSIDEFQKLLLAADAIDPWIQAAKKSFEGGSPSSRAIIYEQLRRGKQWSLEEVFQAELNLSVQCSLHPDFAEGVRALLVDKDHSPKWQPSTLDAVTPAWVSGYFTPYWQPEDHPFHQLKNL
ncbi:enoyl-CoA hydratase/isomerase family protein [Flavobacterium sp. JP2137]|uniref:enoyl-CoA hydratase/isomerase family protein n=1 Tax=Flavobacterium sp. JP2137 TaxID=3414510 RepID=UPI003D2F9EA5